MNKYKVKVDINDTQFWEVEAESEQEAMDNYMEGSHYHTKSHGEDIEVIEEITFKVYATKEDSILDGIKPITDLPNFREVK